MYTNIDGKMTIDKDPNAVLAYGIDLIDWLDGAILTGVDMIDVVGVTAANAKISGTKVSATISGGNVGEEAHVTFRFSGSSWNDDRTIHFNIVER